MSEPQSPRPAKLIISLLMKDKGILSSLAKDLEELFGPFDILSAWLPFEYTSYYEPEMGGPLFRRLVVFKKLIKQSSLADIKLKTNDLETALSSDRKRSVNIDPGYLLLERFVLATGKNFTHRIYIGRKIYADLTLIYQKGGFKTLPWTYPDYSDDTMLAFLEKVRMKYILDLKDFEKND